MCALIRPPDARSRNGHGYLNEGLANAAVPLDSVQRDRSRYKCHVIAMDAGSVVAH
jgi:hypothetical protein